jgi:hypothetical protein
MTPPGIRSNAVAASHRRSDRRHSFCQDYMVGSKLFLGMIPMAIPKESLRHRLAWFRRSLLRCLRASVFLDRPGVLRCALHSCVLCDRAQFATRFRVMCRVARQSAHRSSATGVTFRRHLQAARPRSSRFFSPRCTGSFRLARFSNALRLPTGCGTGLKLLPNRKQFAVRRLQAFGFARLPRLGDDCDLFRH